MRVLVAPDKFKGALDAEAAAAAIAEGVRAARPDAEVVVRPMADGGEGTGAILAKAFGAQERMAVVLDPLGRPRTARWWLCRGAAGAKRTGIVEMAEASGLALLDEPQRDPLRTSSFGTGQLLRAAIDAGCTRVLVGVGGSATVDGGAGCLQALGWVHRDRSGAVLEAPIRGGMVSAIDAVEAPVGGPAVEVNVLVDVDNPLLGTRGAAVVFGPQKGATPDGVRTLDTGLERWAVVLSKTQRRPSPEMAGMGAAGGLPFGLAAMFNARLRPGVEAVADAVGLRERMKEMVGTPGSARAALCITGEGRLDEQTAGGKVVAGVARLAGEVGVPTVALVGAVRSAGDEPPHGDAVQELAERLGLRAIIAITPPDMPLAEALPRTAEHLRAAAGDVVKRWGA